MSFFYQIGIVMQADRFATSHCLTNDEITYIDKVTQFAEAYCNLGSLEQVLGFAVQNFQTVESTFESQIGTHNANIVAHNLLQLLE